MAQCVVFLIAGYDTTASTLAFASHLLAQNVKQQQLLRQEIQEMVEREGELTYADVMEAKLLDACINGNNNNTKNHSTLGYIHSIIIIIIKRFSFIILYVQISTNSIFSSHYQRLYDCIPQQL